jgi:maleate cis-trans isomerase
MIQPASQGGRSRGYAWRALIGVIQPTHRGKQFAVWYKNAPDGVEIIPTFVGFRSGQRETFLQAYERAEQLAEQLKEVGCDLVSMSGTPPFLLKGLDFEREWAAALSRKLGLHVVTPMEPHAIALEALGVRRVAIASYFGSELNQAIVDYFARFGIQSVVMPGLRLTDHDEGLFSTPLLAMEHVSYQDVYRHCRLGLQESGASVDAIYINGGGWDAEPAIELLERDLRLKVVWALAAEMWLVYHLLAISSPMVGLGSLLSGDYHPARRPGGALGASS